MATASNEFFISGGTLRADAPCYVERQADRDLLHGLLAGEFCYVLTSRQMGKSSLMARTAQMLREQGVRVVVLDLTAIGQNVTAEQWYDGLALRMGNQLRLEDELEDFWQENLRLGPCQRWFAALRDCLLARLKGAGAATAGGLQPEGTPAALAPRLVVFIDELDAVLSLPFPTEEFFAALRECYHRRAQDRELERLTFCLLGVAAPFQLMKDAKTTPFNIGRRIELADFSPAEAQPLAGGLPRLSPDCHSLDTHKLLDRIVHWTHGHPYLTQRLCRAAVESAQAGDRGNEESLIDRLCEELFFSARSAERDDNLVFVRERLLRTGADLASLLEVYERVLAGEPVPDHPLDLFINQLHLAGIVRVDSQRLAVRNRIYERVFDRAWISAVKPLAELEKPDGQRVRIKGTCSLGRTDNNDVVLADVMVSRRHALIQKQGQDELWLVDLGSRNGTRLNGSLLVRPTLLQDQDQIVIGPCRLLFHQPNAPRRVLSDQTTLGRTVIQERGRFSPPAP
ncbi:MAG TPA: AAA-like domain-containing protein [Dongiaceae bacterium]|nr:AAA-like domain-containing protein [Dongiaceae bacterium]